MSLDMSNQNSQVVVAFDFTQSARAALFRAIALANRAPFHTLHFVCVIEPHRPIASVGPGPVDYKYAERVQQAIADEVTQELRAASITNRVHFFTHARIGKPADEILSVAFEVGADLIIVGTKGLTGVEHFVLGSIAEKICREAGCTVEVARPKTYNYVDLQEITEVEPHPHYVRPHHYSYEDNRVSLRPSEWPLY
jgi:nucleotide-binding universal stress UspA family protein